MMKMMTQREYRIIQPEEGEGWIVQCFWKASLDDLRSEEIVCSSTKVLVTDEDLKQWISETVIGEDNDNAY